MTITRETLTAAGLRVKPLNGPNLMQFKIARDSNEGHEARILAALEPLPLDDSAPNTTGVEGKIGPETIHNAPPADGDPPCTICGDTGYDPDMERQCYCQPAPPADPDMPASQMRMHFGEMTAREMRIARAAIRFANSRLIPADPLQAALELPEVRTLVDYARDATAGFAYIQMMYGNLHGVGWERLAEKQLALSPIDAALRAATKKVG